MKWFWTSSLCYNNFRSKNGTSNKIRNCRLPKNPKTQNKYQKILMTSDKHWEKAKNGQNDIEKTLKIYLILLLLVLKFQKEKRNLKTF